ncbi:hypothetical protein GCM10023342_06410 [Modicisalibacter zincidurans]|uniref:Uncharacterized protein n=1 Tax=Modicisalibacter zincidurans TaxID=1178777 RepID=A0ABP9R568_9GAMM
MGIGTIRVSRIEARNSSAMAWRDVDRRSSQAVAEASEVNEGKDMAEPAGVAHLGL